jgi:MinD superfamily P-loop ATPase
MKEVVVVSGKGGTGKTTVLAGYAWNASNAVVADCDVDAPNLHMLLEPMATRSEAFSGSNVAVVDTAKCRYCGKCERYCRFEAISTIGDEGKKRIIVDDDSCEGCGVCARVCPEDAIGMRDRIVGEWFISETERGAMVHALLEPGAENSGRLVAMVKQMAKATAKERGAELMLVDGPPGIGCPVISALSGADIVVIVAEPTVSGLSDFKRIADLINGFKMKSVLVVNKADLNCSLTESLLEEATRKGISCLGRIPYDESLLTAMARGKDGTDGYRNSPAMAEISKTYEALQWFL